MRMLDELGEEEVKKRQKSNERINAQSLKIFSNHLYLLVIYSKNTFLQIVLTSFLTWPSLAEPRFSNW